MAERQVRIADSFKTRALVIAEPAMLIACPVCLVLCAVLRVESVALVISAIALLSVVPFLIRFEMARPAPADIMPIVVMSAAAIVGRIAFLAIPNFQPVTAIVIFTGIYFGRQSGYLTGMFTALVSNMALGQGIWTPWQMYAWGLIGYLAGVLFSGGAETVLQRRSYQIAVYIFGAASTAVYSVIVDTWYVIGFLKESGIHAMIGYYTLGLSFNILHIIATVIFLMLMLVPWGKKIRRIKLKYGR